MTVRRRLILAGLVAAVGVVVVVISTRSHEKQLTALPAGSATSVAVAPDGTVILGGDRFVVDGSRVDPVPGPVAAVTPGGLAAATALAGGRYVPELLRSSGDVLARAPVGDGDAVARGVADTPGGGAVMAADATRGGRHVVAIARYDGSGHALGASVVSMPGRSLSAAGVAVTRGGSIVVAGTAYAASGNSDVFVARAGGTPRVLPSGAEGTVARALALDSTGRAVIAATGRRSGRSAFIALFEARPAAIVAGSGEAFATGVALDRGGSVVLAGRVDGHGTLVRLTPGGAVDGSFHPPPLPGGPQLSVAPDPAGGLVVAGTRIAGGRERVWLVRVPSG